MSVVAPGSEDLQLFNGLLAHYHYLGHRNTVGENLRYLVRDRQGRPVACALFGSAAWQCAARDAFLGWDRATRERNLQGLTNNTRLLVPPWVSVPHLASHVLGRIARRIRTDWQAKYGHPVHALETFVDRSRFRGNLLPGGQLAAAGRDARTRNDREHRIRAAVKDVYLYPLIPNFQRELRPPPPPAPACAVPGTADRPEPKRGRTRDDAPRGRGNLRRRQGHCRARAAGAGRPHPRLGRSGAGSDHTP